MAETSFQFLFKRANSWFWEKCYQILCFINHALLPLCTLTRSLHTRLRPTWFSKWISFVVWHLSSSRIVFSLAHESSAPWSMIIGAPSSDVLFRCVLASLFESPYVHYRWGKTAENSDLSPHKHCACRPGLVYALSVLGFCIVHFFQIVYLASNLRKVSGSGWIVLDSSTRSTRCHSAGWIISIGHDKGASYESASGRADGLGPLQFGRTKPSRTLRTSVLLSSRCMNQWRFSWLHLVLPRSYRVCFCTFGWRIDGRNSCVAATFFFSIDSFNDRGWSYFYSVKKCNNCSLS